jgi:hypothetical protein
LMVRKGGAWSFLPSLHSKTIIKRLLSIIHSWFCEIGMVRKYIVQSEFMNNFAYEWGYLNKVSTVQLLFRYRFCSWQTEILPYITGNTVKFLLYLYVKFEWKVRSERRKLHLRGARFPPYKCEVFLHQSAEPLDPPLNGNMWFCSHEGCKVARSVQHNSPHLKKFSCGHID